MQSANRIAVPEPLYWMDDLERAHCGGRGICKSVISGSSIAHCVRNGRSASTASADGRLRAHEGKNTACQLRQLHFRTAATIAAIFIQVGHENAFKRNDLSAAVKRTFTEELTSEKCREKTSQR
jgi:hypothetical protein